MRFVEFAEAYMRHMETYVKVKGKGFKTQKHNIFYSFVLNKLLISIKYK